MDETNTTVVVQRYLNELGDEDRRDEIVAKLLTRTLFRLQRLCNGMLRQYSRLEQGPVNLQSQELLSILMERLLKALRKVRPATPRQFFGLANQHIRWALNDLVSWLDKQPVTEPVSDVLDPGALSDSALSPSPQLKRILQALAELPAEESEVFDLVRIQGLTQTEAAELLGLASKTIQRRLNRALIFLGERLVDLAPPSSSGAS